MEENMPLKNNRLLFVTLFLLSACNPTQSPAPLPELGQPAAPSETRLAPPVSTEMPGESETPTEAAMDYEWFDESPVPDQFTVVRVGENDGQLLDILRSEAKKAADLDRQPHVEFYADWCPPCKAIRDNLGDERMVDAFSGTYIIKLDHDYWKNKLSGTGLYVPGIPAFYEVDTEGVPTGRMITGAAWGEDVPENIAPPMKEFFTGEQSE